MTSLVMTRAERESFLAEPRIGVLSVADGEHGPLVCPVWYAYEPGGDVVFVTSTDSRKADLLRRAKRATFLAQSEELPYKYVSLEGAVSVEDADLDRDVRPIAHRYLGAEAGDGYLAATRSQPRPADVVVRIRPERWRSTDYSKQFADAGR